MFSRILLGVCCVAIAVAVLVFLVGSSPHSAGLAAALGACGLVGLAFQQTDKTFYTTKALPNGAASVTSDGFDLENGTRGEFLANCELLITAPALVVGDLANGETMTYIVEHDTAVAFGTAATLLDRVIVQTGAGGAGAAAATKRVRLPAGVSRYVRVKATNSGAGDASDKSMTVELKF